MVYKGSHRTAHTGTIRVFSVCLGTVARAVTMIEEVQSAAYWVSSSVMHRIVHYSETRSYVRWRGQGRNRATSAVDDRFVSLLTLMNPQQTARQTRNRLQEIRNVNVSERTLKKMAE